MAFLAPLVPILIGAANLGTITSGLLAGVSISALAAGVSSIALSYGISSIEKNKAKKRTEDRQASVATMQLGEGPRQALFGLCVTGGRLMYAFNSGDKNEYETLVLKLADHWVDGDVDPLQTIFVNDEAHSFTGDGAVAAYTVGGVDHLEVWFVAGAPGDTAPASMISHSAAYDAGDPWVGSDTMTGCCYVVVRYRYSASVWPGGRPQFRFQVRSARWYDPRNDSTVPGGSGSEDFTDPTTWGDTVNPVVLSYNFRRGVWNGTELMVGMGLTAFEAPGELTFADSNICDESVDLDGGGSESRYYCGLIVDADQPFIDVLQDFAATCGGFIGQAGGRLAIKAGAAQTPSFSFTDADLVQGAPIGFEPFLTREDRVNTVIARYLEPLQNFNTTSAPMRRDAADVTADGRPYESVIELPGVFSNTQAQRIGEIRRRCGRLERRATVTLPPRFINVEVGDWGTWTSDRYLDGEAVIFQVEAADLAISGRQTLRLREISAECFDWDETVDELAPGETLPATVSLPFPAAVSMSSYNARFGRNQVVNSQFDQNTYTTAIGWYPGGAGDTGLTYGYGYNVSGYYGHRSVAWSTVSGGTPAAGKYFIGQSLEGSNLQNCHAILPQAKEGDRVFISCLLAAWQCSSVALAAIWIDGDGAYISETSQTASFTNNGGADGDPDNFTRTTHFFEAPADTRFVSMHLIGVCDGDAFPYLFFTEVMISVVPAGQEGIPEYEPGPLRTPTLNSLGAVGAWWSTPPVSAIGDTSLTIASATLNVMGQAYALPGASITGLSNSTLYYVTYDFDAAAFATTTSLSTAASRSGDGAMNRHLYIGSATTHNGGGTGGSAGQGGNPGSNQWDF